jgi:hypothetical protein
MDREDEAFSAMTVSTESIQRGDRRHTVQQVQVEQSAQSLQVVQVQGPMLTIGMLLRDL